MPSSHFQQHFLIFLLTLLVPVLHCDGQDTDRKIQFPDLGDHQTLVCDFHIHTVFSDGSVWPDIRIEEAVRDGLDAIALTEHIEYQPHGEDIPHPDRNRSYVLAKEYAKPHDLIVIHGAEITRDLPPGHANAIFITDANRLNVEDSLAAYAEAVAQGAFVFWNHPNWLVQQEDALPVLTDLHRRLIGEGLLHGIEVVNDLTFSVEALDLAKEAGLTVMGTSDIHGLVDWQYEVAMGGHRPVCLVFAEDKSPEAIKESLFAGKTVAWFNNLLVGKADWLSRIVNASLHVEDKGYIGPSRVQEIVIYNNSDAHFMLQHDGTYTFYSDSDTFNVQPHGERKIQVIRPEGDESGKISFTVLNAVSGKGEHAVVSFNLE